MNPTPAKPADFDTYVCPTCKTQNFQASKLGPWHAHAVRCACGWTGHGRGLVKPGN